MCDTAIVQTTFVFSLDGKIKYGNFCDSYARYIEYGIDKILQDVEGEWELDELNFDFSSNSYDSNADVTLAWTKIDLLVTNFSDEAYGSIDTKLLVEDCMINWIQKFNYKDN